MLGAQGSFGQLRSEEDTLSKHPRIQGLEGLSDTKLTTLYVEVLDEIEAARTVGDHGLLCSLLVDRQIIGDEIDARFQANAGAIRASRTLSQSGGENVA